MVLAPHRAEGVVSSIPEGCPALKGSPPAAPELPGDPIAYAGPNDAVRRSRLCGAVKTLLEGLESADEPDACRAFSEIGRWGNCLKPGEIRLAGVPKIRPSRRRDRRGGRGGYARSLVRCLRDLVLTELVRRRRLVGEAALEACAAEATAEQPVAQLLVARRLLAPAVLSGLREDAAAVELACSQCGRSRRFFELEGTAPPVCPDCGGELAVQLSGPAPTPPALPAVARRSPPRNPLAETQPDPPTPDPDGPDRMAVTVVEGPEEEDPPAAGDAPAGERLGPYALLEELGRGGMGVVYRARAPGGEEVALKVLLGGRLASEGQVKRFLREARLAARLDHPGIVRVRDVGEAGERHYLVMDLVSGKGLDEALKREAFGPERTARLGRDLARALAHAHARGVIHRDVKPANVLLTEGDVPRLTDFGLAREAEPTLGVSMVTQDGALVGTPFYMSPEQALGERDAVGPKADVYALGTVLFQLLTGRLPFVAETQMELTEQLLHVPPPRLRSLRPELDAALEGVILAALAKAPEARPSAEALADDLERYLAGGEVEARGEGATARLKLRARSHGGVLAAGAGGFLAALLAGAAVLGVSQWIAADRAARAAAEEEAAAKLAAQQAAQAALDDRQTAARHATREALAAVEAVSRASSEPVAIEAALQEAARRLTAALAEPLMTGDPGLLVLRGRVHERLGRRREAQADYRRALAADPLGGRGAEATFLLARLLLRQDARGEAQAALERRRTPLPGEAPPPQQRPAWSPTLDPERSAAWEELVSALRRHLAGDDAAALRHAEQAQALDAELTEAFAVEGLVANALGRTGRVLRALEQVVALDPQDPNGWTNLAGARFSSGGGAATDADEAVRSASAALERALAIDPRHPGALDLRSRTHEAAGRMPEALRDLERVLQHRPDDPDLLFRAAQLCLLDQQGGRAGRLLDRLARVAPGDPRPYRLRAATRLEQGDVEGALSILEAGLAAAGEDPAARRTLQRLHERIALPTRRLDAAQRQVEARLREAPEDPDALTSLARVQLRRGDLAAARATVAAVQSRDPLHAASWELSVQLGLEAGWGPEQVTAAARARAEAHPEAATALAAAAKLLTFAGIELPQADAWARRALELEPECAPALVVRGAIASRRQQAEQARAFLQQALTIDPRHVDAMVVLGVVQLGEGRAAEAELLLRAALAEDPFRADALEPLGVLYVGLKRASVARQVLGAVVDVLRAAGSPPPPGVAGQLATAQLADGDEAAALRLLERLAGEFPDAPAYPVLLAQVHARAGRAAAARALLDEVLREHPDLPQAAALRRQLGE